MINFVVATGSRAPSQYPKRRLFVRSRKVSKPRDLYLEFCDRSEIWQALRQQCCRCACQISNRYDNLKYQSRGFETLRDLTKRRLFGYWDGALMTPVWRSSISHAQSPAKTSTRIFATGGGGDSDTCLRDNVVTWQRRLRLLSIQTCALVIARRGETTTSGVWHQQYTHNHVWSLKQNPATFEKPWQRLRKATKYYHLFLVFLTQYCDAHLKNALVYFVSITVS